MKGLIIVIWLLDFHFSKCKDDGIPALFKGLMEHITSTVFMDISSYQLSNKQFLRSKYLTLVLSIL